MTDERPEHWRDPPGWAQAITRVAELTVFGGPPDVGNIRAHFAALMEIIDQELPPSDVRDRLLGRIADLEAAALIDIGALTKH
ncbi:MAG TPA: hypothetical protein VKE42_09085 [Candidatus Cybelea sp.]|nr:hypothetical protein [Candidatus Cybelea sp.]